MTQKQPGKNLTTTSCKNSFEAGCFQEEEMTGVTNSLSAENVLGTALAQQHAVLACHWNEFSQLTQHSLQ